MNPVPIRVVLTENGETDTLVFFPDAEAFPKGIMVNLNSPEAQTDLKKVFSALLKNLEKFEISLQLEVADGYSKGLYKDVSEEYIQNLNEELSVVFHRIQEELRR